MERFAASSSLEEADIRPLYADVVLPLSLPPLTFLVDGPIAGRIARGSFVAVPLGERKLHTGLVIKLHNDHPGYASVKRVVRLYSSLPPATEEQLKFFEWLSDYYIAAPGDVLRAALPAGLRPEGSLDKGIAEFAPRTVTCVRIADRFASREEISAAFEMLKRTKGQYKALAEIAGRSPSGEWIQVRSLGSSRTLINKLAGRGILILSEQEERRGSAAVAIKPFSTGLSARIEAALAQKATLLYEGALPIEDTAVLSGKVLSEGRDALLLLPDAANIPAVAATLGEYFDGRLILCHSNLSNRQRSEAFRLVALAGEGRLVIGTRASLFLPFRRLGLIVVDNEHSDSYKQESPPPRYNGRDAALVLASLCGAKTLLSSITPSSESRYNVNRGKFGCMKGEQGPQCRVVVSDTARAVRRGERRSHLNRELREAIDHRLAAGGSIMLLQNRLGFSSHIECPECGWTAKCPKCDAALVLYKGKEGLKCRHCNHAESIVRLCPECGKSVEYRGYGTEKIETELSAIFPKARIARFDSDTITSPSGAAGILERFAGKEIDILVGTRLMLNGIGRQSIGLAGIVNADNMLNMPDFRSSERTFALISAVREAVAPDGLLIIQTSHPENPLFDAIKYNDGERFASAIDSERHRFNYPPYCRIVTIEMRYKDEAVLVKEAEEYATALRRSIGAEVIGPQEPLAERIKGEHILQTVVKIPRGSDLYAIKAAIAARLRSGTDKRVRVAIDVDPL